MNDGLLIFATGKHAHGLLDILEQPNMDGLGCIATDPAIGSLFSYSVPGNDDNIVDRREICSKAAMGGARQVRPKFAKIFSGIQKMPFLHCLP